MNLKKNEKMDIKTKADQVFQSGLAFQIYNKPVSNDYLWDIRLFWKHMESDGKTVAMANHNHKGFADLNDCFDDILKYLEDYDKI